MRSLVLSQRIKGLGKRCFIFSSSRNKPWSGKVAQLVDCLLSVHKALGPIPSTARQCTPANPAFGEWRQKQKFEVIHSCIVTSGSAWTIGNLTQTIRKDEGTGEGEREGGKQRQPSLVFFL